jgi:putative nucleotidyltransferase with HDIG domain
MPVELENVTEEEKQAIKDALPEINEIKNKELRQKVALAWALALKETSHKRLEDIDTAGLKGFPMIEHLRGVARMAIGSAEGLKKISPDFSYNRDVLIAGALCHDIGAPFQYDPENLDKWKKDIGRMGMPAIRHPAYGVYVTMKAGFPLEVVHIVGAHSPEGDFLKRSIECSIVYHEDCAWWELLYRARHNAPSPWEKPEYT